MRREPIGAAEYNHRSVEEKRKSKNFAPIADRLAAARAAAPPPIASQITTIEEQIAAISRGDFEAALQRASPDVELEIYAPPEFPFICRARGTAEMREAMQHNFAAVEDQHPVVSNVLTQGHVVVMFGTETGRIRATGASYRVEFVHRFTFANGTLQNVRIIAARAA